MKETRERKKELDEQIRDSMVAMKMDDMILRSGGHLKIAQRKVYAPITKQSLFDVLLSELQDDGVAQRVCEAAFSDEGRVKLKAELRRTVR
jgi:predicted nucleotidyltransferase